MSTNTGTRAFGSAGRLLRVLGLGALSLTLSLPAMAADSATWDRLDRLDTQIGSAQIALDTVTSDVTNRTGFFGAEEAKRRYEDGVYHYLVGEYDTSAKTFFTLVEARAFPDGSFYQADSQWYLAESLFALGNYALAEEAYETIVGQERHLHFQDGVLRQMELYSLTGQTSKFYDLYERFIVTGRVPSNDVVRYTVAKSFWRQGETLRAKSLLAEINDPGSLYFGKARYVSGAMLVAEAIAAQESTGKVPMDTIQAGIDEFEQAAAISIATSQDRELVDLSNLALGRLHFELAKGTTNVIEQNEFYGKSAEYYQRISRDSPYFADALYEIAWTFIAEGDYEQALQSVEIFLLGFPDHRYTAELKLLEGHLNMKMAEFESALVNYEGVVTEYTPIHDAILAIEKDDEQPLEWFGTLVQLEDLGLYYDEDIPQYAVEMLANDPEVGRALAVSRELERQKQEIAESEVLIEELDEAFASGEDAISSFNQARLELSRLELELNQIRGELLTAEEAWLLANLPDSMQPEVRALQKAREDLVLRQGDDAAAAAEKRATELRDRAEKVGRDAEKVRIQVEELSAQSASLEAQLAAAEIGAEDRARVEQELTAVKADLAHASQSLDTLDREQAALNSQAFEEESQGASLGNRILAEGYEGLRKQLSNYRRHVTDPDKARFTREVDAVWSQADAMNAQIASLMERIDSLEGTELATLRQRYAEEVVNVADSRSELDVKGPEAAVLADAATRNGFRRLRETLAESVLKADKGIVDVYWVRKVEVSDQLQVRKLEREALLKELNDRFTLIRSGLPDTEALEDPAQNENSTGESQSNSTDP